MITFLASLPPIQSAIKVGQDGMRFSLDVPESEMGNAVELLAMRGKVLKITIETLINSKEQQQNGEREALSTWAKRKSERKTAQK